MPRARRRLSCSSAALLGSLALAGCVGAAANHERIADEAYADGRYRDALLEYRLALSAEGSKASRHAKAGAAALNAGELEAAAAEFVALGRADGEGQGQVAADGLVRVANAAIERGDQLGLAAAIEGLQTVAPGRALGAFAGQVAQALGEVAQTPEALNVLMYAAAAAPDAQSQDSLMFAYGTLLRRLGRCEKAALVLEGLVRRQRDDDVARGAGIGFVQCALRIGRAALDRGQPSVAEDWFQRAATAGGTGVDTRAAYLGLGDVRFARGDVMGAIEAFEQARAGLRPGDAMYRQVAERLNRLARPQ
ncbi:MAG: tetratricopeptide repeat protein [Gemmatimonadota bacterium]|nr:tetratricopeptide repeat protein [Gemmatimonadota bacterium]